MDVNDDGTGSEHAAETAQQRAERLRKFLEEEVWPQIPPEDLGKPITKEEVEDILGFGPGGV